MCMASQRSVSCVPNGRRRERGGDDHHDERDAPTDENDGDEDTGGTGHVAEMVAVGQRTGCHDREQDDDGGGVDDSTGALSQVQAIRPSPGPGAA